MSRPLKLLCLTDIRFWLPNNGSDRRIAGLLEFLARDWSIAVFFPGAVTAGEARRALRLFPFLRLYHPGGCASAEQESRAETALSLEDALRSEKSDVLLAEYYWVTKHLKACRPRALCNVLTVLDTLDVMHTRSQAFAEHGIQYGIQLTRDEEAYFLDHYDWVLAIQEIEAGLLRSIVRRPVLCVTHGNPIQPSSRTGYRDTLRIGLVSSKGEAQYHAAHWFLKTLWLPLRRAVPGLELHVFGTLGERLPDAELPIGVTRRGFASDLRAAYAEFDIAINPAQFGSGINIKTVEALCHGKPLLSTPAGLFGLPPAGPSEPFYRCITPDDWTRAIVELWQQPGQADAIQRRALIYAQQHFSPEAAYGPFSRQLANQAQLGRPAGEVDLNIRIKALLRQRPDWSGVQPHHSQQVNHRICILGTGTKAALLRACLPPGIAAVAHVVRLPVKPGLTFLDRPILPLSLLRPSFTPALIVTDNCDEPSGFTVRQAGEFFHSIVIFGTGAAAQQAIQLLGGTGSVLAFCDNDAAKQGTTWQGRPVIAPSELSQFPEARIVVASMHHVAISAQLVALGIARDQIGAFDITTLAPKETGYDPFARARQLASYFFDFTEETVAELLVASFAAATVVVPAVSAVTLAAAVVARSAGCQVTLASDLPGLEPLGTIGFRIEREGWVPTQPADLVLTTTALPLSTGTGTATLAAQIDACGAIRWSPKATPLQSIASLPPSTGVVATP